MKPLRFLFVVQGEGRGHMTQALSMQTILQTAGHSVCAVLIGKNKEREIPSFFKENIQAPLFSFDSPNFVISRNKSIKIFQTINYNLLKTNTFVKSLRFLHERLEQYKPDLILSFYEALTGLYYWHYKPKIPLICIAHQYLVDHPSFTFPPKHSFEKKAFLYLNKINSLGASARLALSFYTLSDYKKKKIYVVPPLLRPEVKKLVSPQIHNHYLIYLLNAGYSKEIIAWHNKNKDIVLHCFWDKKDAQEEYKYSDTLTFHKINGEKFLQYMSTAKGYISTAGFESICEAIYLGKPVFMVPVKKHFEQLCNAHDAQKAGAGMYDTVFDMDKFITYLPQHKTISKEFRTWADQAPEKIVEIIEKVYRSYMRKERRDTLHKKGDFTSLIKKLQQIWKVLNMD